MFLIRFLLLCLAIVVVAIGGYWSIHHDLDQIVGIIWKNIYEFDLTIAIQAGMFWLRKLSLNWLVIEVPKRLFIFLIAPYLIMWCVSRSVHRRWRRRLSQVRQQLNQITKQFVAWLRNERMFGSYAKYAVILIAALIFFIFFYSIFWTYLAIVLGFIKLPGFVVGVFSFLGKKILWLLEKTPFGLLMNKVIRPFLVWIDNMTPWYMFYNITPEEKRRKARQKARKAILLRYKREHWFEAVTLSTYRKLLSRKGRSETTTTAESKQDRGSTHGETE